MYINISFQNFFRRSKGKWERYFCFYKPISKNKNIEIETTWSNYEIFKLQLDFHSRGRDHAGFYFDINLFGWELSFRIYDSRHWDYEKWLWEE